MVTGILQTHTILDKIVNHKVGEIAAAEQAKPLASLVEEAKLAPPARDFKAALQAGPHIALIAEVKHASPSKGVLIDPFYPVEIAQFYANHGAAAISILTDEAFFQGHLDHLRAIRAEVDLPLLRKEFILSPYQIYEARAAGADAVLLIVACLEDSLLADLQFLAQDLGLGVLVEVHDQAELDRALKIGCPIIGVNNRDLRDFSMDLSTTPRLAASLPSGTVLVGESGIKTAGDVGSMGPVDAILVGETVVTAPNRGEKMAELTSVKRAKL
jgi:indole-3-glycerol phosphate synthase